MQKLKRREFIKKGAAATLVGGTAISACSTPQSGDAPAVRTRKNYEWQMVTTWPPGFPVMGEGAEMMAKWIEDASDGQMKINVFGGGELVPAFESFEAVSQGVAHMSHGVSYYWAGKSEATPFFGAVPFGMNTQQMNAWIYCGGGLELWEELYAPFNILPMPAGNTGMQMGGWFNKQINSIEDIKGLKMRIPGLGGKVIDKAGGTGLSTPGSEIYTNLDRGVIDATEWVGPYHDYKLGLHKIADYYYYPGWHEPCAVLELGVNRPAFEALPSHLQQIIRSAAARANIWMLSEFEAKNNEYLQKLVNENNVDLRRFPDDVLAAFQKHSQEIIDDVVNRVPMAKKIYASYSTFRKAVTSWAAVTEQDYYTRLSKI